MKEIEYKYNYWVLIPFVLLSLIMMNPIYRMVTGYQPSTVDDYWHAALILLLDLYLLILSSTMLFKLFKGIPALALDSEHLIVNTKNVAISWADIKSVRINGIKSNYLIIELLDSSKYFPDSLKRRIYRISSLLRDNEFAIGLTLIIGNNEEILATINKFHAKCR